MHCLSLKTRFKHSLFNTSLVALLYCSSALSSDNIAQKLPDLGASSTVIPLAEEYYLGRAWLAAFRSHELVTSDVIVTDYLEHLVFHLVPYASMEQYKVLPIVVQSNDLNAFAVPGGVVGINTGLVLYTKTEDQLASVIAHELAHITQRHFARSAQSQKKSTIPMLAGLLVGIAAIAAGEADAGLAAISATQAIALENQLKHSRQHEREADRTGLGIMSNAGFEPTAAAEMFKIMLDRSRLNRSGYTYLSSHPVTENRIADMRNRANELIAVDTSKPSNDFLFIKATETVKSFTSPKQAIEYFQSPLLTAFNEQTRHYGLARAYLADKQAHKAVIELERLLKADPERLIFAASYGEALMKAGRLQEALTWLAQKHKLNPSNYPLSMIYARALESSKGYQHAQQLLRRLSQQRRHDPEIWYQLAELSGLAGDIHALHLARAEYFRLMGQYRSAKRQLTFLMDDPQIDSNTRAIAEQRLQDIRLWQQRIKF